MNKNLREQINAILDEGTDMLVTVGKKVVALEQAPEIVQVRWFKQRIQDLEAKLTPAPKPKTKTTETAPASV